MLLTPAGDPMPVELIARLVGCRPAEVKKLLAELRAAGVYAEHDGAIVSRRMVRDEAERQAGRANGKAGGNPKLKPPTERPLTPRPTPGDNPPANPQSPEARVQSQSISCPEPAKPPASGPADPTVMSLPTSGNGAVEWHLTAAKLAEYQQSFPGVDVLAECRKARQWCLDNHNKRKTPRGMPKFLGSWLGKAQDRGRPPTTPPTAATPAEIERRTAARLDAFNQPIPPASFRTPRPQTPPPTQENMADDQ